MNIYEIREAKDSFRIYDKNREKYILNTDSRKKALKLMKDLSSKGFEGNIPDFFLFGQPYGIKCT